MSHFTSMKAKFLDKNALKSAIQTVLGQHVEVEVHETPQLLLGYRGSASDLKANVIVRSRFLSSCSTDFGVLTGPHSQVYVDIGYGITKEKLDRITQHYSANVTMKQFIGRQAETETLADGRLVLRFDLGG